MIPYRYIIIFQAACWPHSPAGPVNDCNIHAIFWHAVPEPNVFRINAKSENVPIPSVTCEIVLPAYGRFLKFKAKICGREMVSLSLKNRLANPTTLNKVHW